MSELRSILVAPSSLCPSCCSCPASAEQQTAELTVLGPPGSPYSGASFVVSIRGENPNGSCDNAGCTPRWVWRGPVYHPWLCHDRPLCRCLTHYNTAGPPRGPAELRAALERLLLHPQLWRPCAACPPPRCEVYRSMCADLALFRLKARVRTPGTTPPSDEQLAGLSPGRVQGWPGGCATLLASGAFSDVTLVLAGDKGPAFRCHRTILGARSAVFRALLREGDDGTVRMPHSDAASFAVFLQHIYSDHLPRYGAAAAADARDCSGRGGGGALCQHWCIRGCLPLM